MNIDGAPGLPSNPYDPLPVHRDGGYRVDAIYKA